MFDADILKYLMLPSTVIALSAITGMILSFPRQTRKWGASCAVAAFVAYVIFASGPISFLLLGHLEYQILPATISDRARAHTLVVLAAHAEADKNIPLSSRVNSAGATRLLEVLSLMRADPESTVIISGGAEVPAIMQGVLVSAGIPVERIAIDAESLSTAESAQHLAAQLGTSPFLLITSAGHMPRAMGAFQKAGMTPRPVPTHYLTKQNWLAIQYFPSPLHLGYSDLAVSEYAALLWYRVKGWI